MLEILLNMLKKGKKIVVSRVAQTAGALVVAGAVMMLPGMSATTYAAGTGNTNYATLGEAIDGEDIGDACLVLNNYYWSSMGDNSASHADYVSYAIGKNLNYTEDTPLSSVSWDGNKLKCQKAGANVGPFVIEIRSAHTISSSNANVCRNCGKKFHSWSYIADGATLTVICDKGCGETTAHAASLTLTASSTSYSGSSVPVTVTAETGFPVSKTESNVVYYESDGATLVPTTNSGAGEAGKAPKLPGTYIAKLTIKTTDGAAKDTTASLTYTISKADITSVTFTEPTAPVVNATPESIVAGLGSNYTGAIAWTPTGTTFGYSTVYTATITLTADDNYKFASDATIPTNWTKAATSTDTSLVLTRTYTATEAAPHVCGSGIKQDGQPATCTEDGFKDYYKCSSCEKFYEEIACTTEITDLETWKITAGKGKINALGHAWGYNASGTTLTATCTNNSAHTLTLTLSASAPNYSGNAAIITVGSQTEISAWEGANLTVPTIVNYAKTDGTDLGTTAPTTVGSYVAKVAVGEVTAQVSFTIEPNHGEDTSNYAYDDTNHWHPCLRTDCTETSHHYNPAAHNYNNDTHLCVCGKIDPNYHQHIFAIAWSTDKDYHWHECTASGHTADCLNDVGAAKGTHGSWNNGKCGTCSYVCLHNGATTGTCSICNKSLGGGYSGGGGGGGYSSPSAPAPSKPNIKVDGDGSINVDGNISGGTVNVSEISKESLKEIVEANSNNTAISIDLSANTGVTSAVITKTSAETIAEVLADTTNSKREFVVITPTASVSIDATALRAIADQAQGNDIQLVVENTQGTVLNTNQQSEIQKLSSGTGRNVVLTFEAYFVSGGTRISNFNGGFVQIGKIDFKVPAGKNPNNYHVYYVPESGKAERYKTWAEGGTLYFGTTHFSDYAIVYEETVGEGEDVAKTDDTEADNIENVTQTEDAETNDTEIKDSKTDNTQTNSVKPPSSNVQGNKVTSPKTGDAGNMIEWLFIILVLMCIAGSVLIKRES